MKYSRLKLAALALLLAAASAPPEPVQPASTAAAERVRGDVEFLASDLLEGRDTGSKGYAIAASYVATQFRSIGLKPAGSDKGWYQQVPFRRAFLAGPAQASITVGGKTIQLPAGEFGARPSLTQQVRSIDAPLVFAGHGVGDPRIGIDDYAGLDVRGKIVVVLEGTPANLPSEVAAHLKSWKEQTASSKGAVGLLEIDGSGRGRSNSVASYSRPVVDWVDPTGRTKSRSSGLPLSMAISRRVAEQVFAASGRRLGPIIAAGKRAGTVSGFDLRARLTFNDKSAWQDFTSPEVIGLLPGADPALKTQYVVLMGHLDHLGVNPAAKPGEDAIYNGALDNAAGVATMLEAARQFVASGKAPRRSVLFIANAGEEKGLRGADYFAANPTVPVSSIVGVVDLDMPLLLYPFTDVVAYGGDHSTIARTIADAAKAMGVAVAADPMPQEAIFVRSDHYRFVTRGIPGILLMTGYANGGERKWKDFLGNAYHRVNDDLNQPIRWDQGARYAELNYRIARALADADERPLWYQGDYFGDSFAQGTPRAPRQTGQSVLKP